MFEMGLYFFLSYLLIGVGFAVAGLVKAIRRRRTPLEEGRLPIGASVRRWRRIRTALILLLPLVPYLVVESQTLVYGARVMPGARECLVQSDEPDQIVALKVLLIWGDEAEVFVVTPCKSVDMSSPIPKQYTSLTCTVVNTSHGWHWKSEYMYDVPWSDCGNEDGNIFPPYPTSSEWSFR